MPTDALVVARDLMMATKEMGFEHIESQAWELGRQVRQYMCEEKGLVSVAAPGFEAPGVVVVFADDAYYAARFRQHGVQIAAGVPWMLGEPDGMCSFRIGLFGLDKMRNVDATVAKFEETFDRVLDDAARERKQQAAA